MNKGIFKWLSAMCIKKSTTDTMSCMWKEVLKQNSLLKQMHNLTVYTMVQWNANVTFTVVTGSHLFPQIKKKKSIHLEDSVAKRDLDWKLREMHRLSLEKHKVLLFLLPSFMYLFLKYQCDCWCFPIHFEKSVLQINSGWFSLLKAQYLTYYT